MIGNVIYITELNNKIMKESLRKRIESLLEQQKYTKQRLIDETHNYSQKGDWEAAMKMDIKMIKKSLLQKFSM